MTSQTIDRIENALLIDGTGAPAVADAVVCLRDGLITFAGAAVDAPARRPDETVVDASGHSVLPGFIDCHVHAGFDGSASLVARHLQHPAVAAFEAADRLRLTLDAGVTTVRDLGGLPVGLPDVLRRGLAIGPRVHTAVRLLSHTSGHGDLRSPCGFDPTAGMSDIVDSPHEVRVAVRGLIRDGADVVKVCATGGMGSPHDHPDDEGLTIEEMSAVVEEVARHGGLPVAAHAQGRQGILNALRAGVTSIEHGYGIDDEGVDRLGEQGAFLVPTLSTVFDGIDQATMQPYHYEKKMRWSETTQVNVGRAIERGARVAMGTDAAVCPHGQNLRELGHLVKLGMSPMDAIVAGTATAARLLGIADTVGTLEPGRIADLVLCDGDPLASIDRLGDPRNIALVLQSGTVRKNTLNHPIPS